MGIHDGHRQRMRERFLAHGLDNFNDINALELLLYYALPRVDTNIIAHRLLDRFGTLSAVLEATAEELMTVEGIGESAAALLRLIPQISRRYMMDRQDTLECISTSERAGRYFLPRFMYERVETVYLACLDTLNRAVHCEEIGRGVVNAADITVRRVVELALKYNSAGVMLAHNHINGLAIPSQEDILTTRRLRDALALVGIKLIDHIIVAGNDFISLADSGALNKDV